MKQICRVLLFFTFAYGHVHAQSQMPVEEFEVSNQIQKSGCELDIQLRVMRWNIREGAELKNTRPPNYIAHGKFQLNGRNLPAPYGMLQTLTDANRVVAPPQQVPCGFVVVTGDASLTGRILVRIERGQITSTELMDTDGRLFAKTLFYYPKAVILN